LSAARLVVLFQFAGGYGQRGPLAIAVSIAAGRCWVGGRPLPGWRGSAAPTLMVKNTKNLHLLVGKGFTQVRANPPRKKRGHGVAWSFMFQSVRIRHPQPIGSSFVGQPPASRLPAEVRNVISRGGPCAVSGLGSLLL